MNTVVEGIRQIMLNQALKLSKYNKKHRILKMLIHEILYLFDSKLED